MKEFRTEATFANGKWVTTKTKADLTTNELEPLYPTGVEITKRDYAPDDEDNILMPTTPYFVNDFPKDNGNNEDNILLPIIEGGIPIVEGDILYPNECTECD